MGQRVAGNPQQFVFHGIDWNNADTANVFFRFTAEHQDDAKHCLAHLEACLHQVAHPDCYHVLFCNKNDVLTYPGHWPLTNLPETPLPPALSEDDVYAKPCPSPNSSNRHTSYSPNPKAYPGCSPA